MEVIRKTALLILKKAYSECNTQLKVSNFNYDDISANRDDVTKGYTYLKLSGFIESKEVCDPNFKFTAKGIDWIEDNFNKV